MFSTRQFTWSLIHSTIQALWLGSTAVSLRIQRLGFLQPCLISGLLHLPYTQLYYDKCWHSSYVMVSLKLQAFPMFIWHLSHFVFFNLAAFQHKRVLLAFDYTDLVLGPLCSNPLILRNCFGDSSLKTWGLKNVMPLMKAKWLGSPSGCCWWPGRSWKWP